MREQLKNLTENDYWVYGVTESDFDHAVSIVREMIEARNHQYESEAARIRGESSETGNDILDDVAYYRYTDNQYLWHFALWRLQGLIEAVITYQLVDKNAKKLYGLKSKLEALVNSGYQIEQNEIDELLLWANLRNAISHAPPEQFRPIPLCEDDIIEYQMFVKKLFVRWRSEKSVEEMV